VIHARKRAAAGDGVLRRALRSRPRAARWHALFIVAAILVAAVVVLAACGGGASTTTSTSASAAANTSPKPGGTFNFPLQANPVYLDPLQGNYESEGTQVQHQVFEGLMTYQLQKDGSMLAVPKIAESYDVNSNATVFTFHLKHGVMFQPPVSREVTAQDFVDEWNRVTNPANKSLTSYILAPIKGCNDSGYWSSKAGLTGVKALDKYTLQVTLRYPFAEFPQTLGHAVAAVAPVDYINKIGEKAFNLKPVGTGPYMVQDWIQNTAVDLVKNPDYWDKANAGYVDKIHMPVYTNTQTEWLAFQKGDLDYTMVPPGSVHAAENNPNVKNGTWTAKKWPALSTYFVYVNMSDKTVGYPAGQKGTILRQALAYSLDQKHVIDNVNEGVGIPATGIIPIGIPGYRPNQSPYTYDLAKAQALVKQYGSSVPTLQYWFNTDLGHQKIAEALQAGWKLAGINVQLSNFEWSTYLGKLLKGNQGAGDQLFRLGWIADYPSMDNFMQLFTSANSGTLSYTFYKNPQFDALVSKARETTDATQREDLYAQAEKMVLTDVACMPVYYYQDFRVTNNRIGGFVLDPMYFVDMWKIWVK
jgi:peptide/nickel transport system substrate-binding protein/oligopeptide transport system substrate-binding protein